MVGYLSMEAGDHINTNVTTKQEPTITINEGSVPADRNKADLDHDAWLRHIVSTIGCEDDSRDTIDIPLSQLAHSLPDNYCSSELLHNGHGEPSSSANQTPDYDHPIVEQENSKDQPDVDDSDQSSEGSHHVQFRECVVGDDDDDDHHVQYNSSDENFHTDDNYCMSLHSSSSSSDDVDSERYAEARAPDGGYGWVIVFVSFMVNLIADGITFSFGVIYLEFVKYFGEGKSKTAWIGSLFLAIPLLSGPIASYLTDRYGCRRVSIAGGILAAAGFILSAFINSIELLFFTFGILAGFGLSLCYVAAIVIVAYYFEKRRSLATGLSVCGSGIGTFIFPPFIDYLITEYGWRGTTLILAGLFLNLCVCGALMRDLEFTKKKKKQRKLSNNVRQQRGRVRTNTASSVDSSSMYSQHYNPSVPSSEEMKRLLQVAAGGGHDNTAEEQEAGDDGSVPVIKEKKDRLFSSLVSLPTFVRNSEKVPLEVLEGLSTNRHLYAVLVHNYPSLLISSRSISDSGCINDPKRYRAPYSTTITPKYSAQFLPSDDNKPSLCETRLSKVESQDAISNEGGKTGGEAALISNSRAESVALKKPEKCRSILKKKSESLRKGLAAVSNTNSTWWNKRYSEYGNESPRLPTAYLRDLKVHRHSLTYRGAMLNIGRYRLRASSCPDIYRNSMTTIAEEKDEWYAGAVDLWHAIKDMMDFSYFRNMNFLLFAISNFLLYTWYDVPYVYLADYAVEQGYSTTDSIYIISVIGILNMLGEILFGWAGDRSWISSRFIYAISIALCGIFVAVIPMVKLYWQMCILAGGFGLFVAANYSLTSIILVESISLEKFTNAYGLLLLVQGIANLVGPPLAGWLYEVTGNFMIPFYLAGFFITLSGCLLEVTTFIDAIKGTFADSNKKSKQIITCSEDLKLKSGNFNNHNDFVP